MQTAVGVVILTEDDVTIPLVVVTVRLVVVRVTVAVVMLVTVLVVYCASEISVINLIYSVDEHTSYNEYTYVHAYVYIYCIYVVK